MSRNDSKVKFKSVVVGGKGYGDIDPGVSTGYQTWVSAYRYSSVTLLADGKTLKIQPFDYTGEKKLGKGNFTYKLTINKKVQLIISAEKDKKSIKRTK